MKFTWKRSAQFLAVAAATAVLAACGSSSVESSFNPSRVVSFGDGTADLGQTGTRYTVNDAGNTQNWSEQVAINYGQRLAAANAGGNAYAQVNSRIDQLPDAVGNADGMTVSKQIDAFLTKGSFNGGDLVLISAGMSDVIVQAMAVQNNQQTREQAIDNMKVAGAALVPQVQKILNNGAQHVAVLGVYTVGAGPWAYQSTDEHFINELSTAFNVGFKTAGVNLANTLFVDGEYYVNNIYNNPNGFGFSTSREYVCNSVATGVGIGTGDNQVDSGLCNPNTLVDANFDRYAFADRVYLTPSANRQMGSWTYDRIRDRW